MQLRPDFDHFPHDQIHLMVFEEHVADPLPEREELAPGVAVAVGDERLQEAAESRPFVARDPQDLAELSILDEGPDAGNDSDTTGH